eukprot:CAMPEP_0172490994 /NCGR_PEP_ID=MMETSP1066-20121228/21648_1 /TAXON_ID=671091 /ORGANISM="Coscinodiscus wailesii, Strain CCMP2513" /LENGTH=160 /DNA_ID=CAMNT_0013259767 /DNA_START=63 /DNA_END=545 /DNA_ORIENTATION=+
MTSFSNLIPLLALIILLLLSSIDGSDEAVVGGFSEAKTDDDDVVLAAEFAFKKYKRENGQEFTSAIFDNLTYRVDHCKRQIVAGTNYRISISIIAEDRCVAAFEAIVFRDLEMNYSEPMMKKTSCKNIGVKEQPEENTSRGNSQSGPQLLEIVALAGGVF